MTTMTNNGTSQEQSTGMPLIIPASLIWHILLAVLLGVLSYRIFTAEVFEVFGSPANLGRPVKNFSAAILLIPAFFGVISSALMLARNGQGRYWALGINFAGAALTGFGLLGLWGVYGSFELLVDGVMANGRLTMGFPIAYLLFWLAGRLFQNENNTIRSTMEMIALGLAGITLMALLLLSGILDGILHIVGTYGQLNVWLATIALIIFIVMTWRILYSGEYFNETPDQRIAWQGWFMLAPNIIGFALFFAGPLLLSFYLSFTDSQIGSANQGGPYIVNFQNYADILALQVKTTDDTEIFAQDTLDFGYVPLMEMNLGDSRVIIGAKDRVFWVSMRNTLFYCLLLLPLAIVPALGMSLILNSKLPGVQFFRAIYFLPSVAAVVGTALIWRWLYQPTEGFINFTIQRIAIFLGLADPNIEWLTNPSTVLISVVVLAAWQIVGYNTVLFLAGLQGIPNVLYEAAQIDGANRWQQFRNVTLPMLAPTTFFVLITTMVTGLQAFNEPYALFPSQPIPENATTAVYYMYRTGFAQGLFGYSSAIAWILFAVIFSLTLLQFRANSNEAYS